MCYKLLKGDLVDVQKIVSCGNTVCSDSIFRTAFFTHNVYVLVSELKLVFASVGTVAMDASFLFKILDNILDDVKYLRI